MDDLLGDFVAETREMLEALGGEIVAWESDPGDRDRLDAIFRFVHTVKGNCGFFELPRLAALSHAAEDALADVRAGRRRADAALVTAVLAVIDRISYIAAAIESGSEWPEGDDGRLVAALMPDGDAAEPLVMVAGGHGARGEARIAQRSVRLPVDLLDRVMGGVSDIVLARNELARRLRDLPGHAAVDSAFERLSAMIADVRDAMTRTRMQPVETLLGTLPRLARDIAAQLGKQVMIDIDGGDVELDREMIELLRDPLTHIVRNAIDHGIEPPARRQAAGKREIGLLTIAARQSGNHILIEIGDDGRGIDGDRLVEKALAAGILSPAEAAAMPPRERLMLICEPGLSTADAVTAISGRGVGMDVVHANIARIGGEIAIDSARGAGTRIALRVPLTLTITPALTVESCGQTFAIPRSYIEEIVDGRADGIAFHRLGDAITVKVRERRLPCFPLSRVLGFAADAAESARTLVIVRLAGGERFALGVGRLRDHEELVIKPLAPAIMATGLYAGTTLTDDGSPILMLDVNGIAREGGLTLDLHARARRTEAAPAEARPARAMPMLVFTALDGRRRALRMGLVERIDQIGAEAVQAGADGMRLVVDGEILALAGINGGGALPSGPFHVARLTDGQATIAHAFRGDADIRALTGAIDPARAPGESEGVALIDGEPVDVIDPHWLFAQFAGGHGTGPARSGSPASRPPACRLFGGDRWVENFLRPIVEAAGYRVIDAADEGHAAIAITREGDDAAHAGAGQVIRLRDDPDGTADAPPSIWRYDRAGLAAALKQARKGAGQ